MSSRISHVLQMELVLKQFQDQFDNLAKYAKCDAAVTFKVLATIFKNHHCEHRMALDKCAHPECIVRHVMES
jgi:hypothetical protein